MKGFLPLGTEIRRALEDMLPLVDSAFPLPGRYRRGLPQDVAELSRLLTGGRGDRTESYLGKPALLSAYLRYFLPWNLYRLCRLLPALPLPLESGDAVTDLGSGPLTLVLALWISRPDLRELSLEFRCLDRTAAILKAGTELFKALAGDRAPWKIRTIRAPLGAPIHGPPARLVGALNLFNELYQGIPEADRRGLGAFAEKNARLLSGLASPSGSILVLEPGVPRSGEFITALRSRLIEGGRFVRAPCPHNGPCPLAGTASRPFSRRWCHFALDTAAAPPELHRLSAAAGLPKERAVLSFLFTGPEGSNTAKEPDAGELPVRIISDPFPIAPEGKKGPYGLDRFGRYGCSERGLVLAAGKKPDLEALESGTLVRLKPGPEEQRDPKSGALLAEFD